MILFISYSIYLSQDKKSGLNHPHASNPHSQEDTLSIFFFIFYLLTDDERRKEVEGVRATYFSHTLVLSEDPKWRIFWGKKSSQQGLSSFYPKPGGNTRMQQLRTVVIADLKFPTFILPPIFAQPPIDSVFCYTMVLLLK